MNLPFTLPERPAAAIAGGGRFPVRRIFCVGRSYAAHAREMGNDPQRESPFSSRDGPTTSCRGEASCRTLRRPPIITTRPNS
jgi:fumarylpyruvate hydrolase